jgi:hypothetical protein
VTKGADHPDTLLCQFNMAFSVGIQTRWVDAHSMFEKLLEKLVRVLPLDDPHALRTTVDLASALNHLERYDESLKIYEDVVPKPPPIW